MPSVKMATRFEDLDVWKAARRLSVQIFKLTESDSFSRDWGFCDQLRKSAISIPSNIAEGYERGSKREFARFLLIAKGSAGELRTQLYIAIKAGKIGGKEANEAIEECLKISGQLMRLIQYLRTKPSGAADK